jgi:hypothetical protein
MNGVCDLSSSKAALPVQKYVEEYSIISIVLSVFVLFYIFVSIPYIGPVFTSNENRWRHFTDSKSCQIIESILKYKKWVFLVLKPQCTAKWHVFYIRSRHISIGSFVYKYDQWPHDSCMTIIFDVFSSFYLWNINKTTAWHL